MTYKEGTQAAIAAETQSNQGNYLTAAQLFLKAQTIATHLFTDKKVALNDLAHAAVLANADKALEILDLGPTPDPDQREILCKLKTDSDALYLGGFYYPRPYTPYVFRPTPSTPLTPSTLTYVDVRVHIYGREFSVVEHVFDGRRAYIRNNYINRDRTVKESMFNGEAIIYANFIKAKNGSPEFDQNFYPIVPLFRHASEVVVEAQWWNRSAGGNNQGVKKIYLPLKYLRNDCAPGWLIDHKMATICFRYTSLHTTFEVALCGRKLYRVGSIPAVE